MEHADLKATDTMVFSLVEDTHNKFKLCNN